jgi:divalent metal cation (Fe/Co/Zn/Cd) transporter
VSAVELPTVPGASAPAEAFRPVASISRERYEELAARVRLLSWLSLCWMTVEGAVAIAAGIVASSIALVGFGLDSGIEGMASLIVVWRFTGHRVFSHAAEERAQKLVAVQFFLLAPYVAFESVRSLIGAEYPEVSWVGIGLALGSLVFMPMLGIAKERLADQLGSAATKGEGRQNMLCAYLAGALLIGLLGNALLGAWWLDPVVGVLIAAVAVREGREAWLGEGCCVSSPLDGAGFAEECCEEDCRGESEPYLLSVYRDPIGLRLRRGPSS